MSKKRKYINGIGIELEGFWRRNSVLSGQHKGDSSVTLYDEDADCLHVLMVAKNRFENKEKSKIMYYKKIDRYSDGDGRAEEKIYKMLAPHEEVVSGVIPSRDMAVKFVEENYPDMVNNSCGMHIHLSFTSLEHYRALASRDFYEAFGNYLKAFKAKVKGNSKDLENLGNRIAGHNKYCDTEFDPCGGDRYYQLNYSAYQKHGTLENRTFPMFASRTLAKKAVSSYIKFVNSWLRKHTKAVIREMDKKGRGGYADNVNVRGFNKSIAIPI